MRLDKNEGSNEGLDDILELSYYQTRISSLYTYIADLIGVDLDLGDVFNDKVLNMYAIHSKDMIELDYLLLINPIGYEVYGDFKPDDIININSLDTLKLILSGELCIAFTEDYNKIVLLNKTLTVNSQVQYIIRN